MVLDSDALEITSSDVGESVLVVQQVSAKAAGCVSRNGAGAMILQSARFPSASGACRLPPRIEGESPLSIVVSGVQETFVRGGAGRATAAMQGSCSFPLPALIYRSG
jgi:hypothetical protein